MYFQLVCNLFLEKFDIDAHIEKVRLIYKNKCALMLGEMDAKFKDTGINLEYTRPDGGFFLWCTLPESIAAGTFVKSCLENKVAVVPGSTFLPDENEISQSFRINFSMPSDANIIAGIDIMAKQLCKL